MFWNIIDLKVLKKLYVIVAAGCVNCLINLGTLSRGFVFALRLNVNTEVFSQLRDLKSN